MAKLNGTIVLGTDYTPSIYRFNFNVEAWFESRNLRNTFSIQFKTN